MEAKYHVRETISCPPQPASTTHYVIFLAVRILK
ncbi:hypothetical protein PG987_000969, partial [Apiospora arundinis]